MRLHFRSPSHMAGGSAVKNGARILIGAFLLVTMTERVAATGAIELSRTNLIFRVKHRCLWKQAPFDKTAGYFGKYVD